MKSHSCPFEKQCPMKDYKGPHNYENNHIICSEIHSCISEQIAEPIQENVLYIDLDNIANFTEIFEVYSGIELSLKSSKLQTYTFDGEEDITIEDINHLLMSNSDYIIFGFPYNVDNSWRNSYKRGIMLVTAKLRKIKICVSENSLSKHLSHLSITDGLTGNSIFNSDLYQIIKKYFPDKPYEIVAMVDKLVKSL